MTLDNLTEQIRAFAQERDWQQFHTLKNLSMAICGEAGELAAVLQWLTDDEISGSITIGGDLLRPVSDEVADVLIYALRFCDVAGIDPAVAVLEKLTLNQARYPIALSRGSAAKYDRLGEPC